MNKDDHERVLGILRRSLYYRQTHGYSSREVRESQHELDDAEQDYKDFKARQVSGSSQINLWGDYERNFDKRISWDLFRKY